MKQRIVCEINGRQTEAFVAPGESLLDMLRTLGYTSVKRGCEVGECGACTVLVDGRSITSCICLAAWADGKSLRTVEGLMGPDGGLSPIQQAFIDEAAVQCGFCTPGFILSAVQILESGKNYTREDIRRLVSGNLCRCTGYENIVNAIAKTLGDRFIA